MRGTDQGLKTQLALFLGGVCGSSAVLLLYYLHRKRVMLSKDPKSRMEDGSQDHLCRVLEELKRSREQTRHASKVITQMLLKAPSTSFEQAYQCAKEMDPGDAPLDRYNLSNVDFHKLLNRYQNNPAVQSLIDGLSAPPVPTSQTSERVKGIAVREIIEIHVFMLNALKDLTTQIQEGAHKDPKRMTIVAECAVNAKVEAEFNLTSEDLEIAVLNNKAALSNDRDFVNVSLNMQSAMGEFTSKAC